MADRSRKEKRPRDTNVRAKSTVALATGEGQEDVVEEPQVPEPTPEERHAAAVALGRLGGKKGGKARAAKMTPEERQESAKKAAQARWSKKSDT
jgi:hypothetical protein